ncbi:MAG TPA: type IV pilus secretin PilQ, partial [Terriglobia bacterium]|nr:type IV pilus secretin PilQ [Terriglobia bacterium]
GRAGVERIRTSYFTDETWQATRVVFDLSRPVPYVIDDDGAGHVRVAFGKQAPSVIEPPRPMPLTDLGPLPEVVGEPPAPQPEMIAQVAGMQEALGSALARPAAPPALLSVTLPAPAAPVAAVAAKAAPAAPVAAVATKAAPAAPVGAAVAGPAPVAPMAAAVTRPALTALIPPTPGPGNPASPQAQPAQYSGEIISLDLKDVDIKDFFRLISDISQLNVVLDPNVGGTLTIMLKDVPWDQALDVVLKNYQFGTQLQGNVLRIATNATLQAEEAARKAARDAMEAASDLEMRAYQLNYTKADTVKPMLQRFLSARGEIVEDIRKNTVFVKDVPTNFSKIDQMVHYLDTPAQQVEIEARLLVANKSFSRDIGNQLGFIFGANHGNILTGGTGVSSPFNRTPAPRVSVGSGSGLPLAVNLPDGAQSGLAFLMQPGGDILLDEIITLAESRGTAKTISRPKITTQNNKSATIQQGTQIPVQTTVNNTVSVQFITFALKLTVTPQITEANTILLDVAVENSQPDFARTVGSGIPSVSTQQATTQVLIPDGGTAAIGGILIDTDSLNVNQVPGLASIPVVGALFKGTKTIKSTGELLFFVTARVRPPDVVEAESR